MPHPPPSSSRPPGRSLAAEDGASLVELLIAIAIGALLIPTLVSTVSLLYRSTTDGNDRLSVAHDVRTTADWLRRDLTPGPTGNNLGDHAGHQIEAAGTTLSITTTDWTAGPPTTRQITYHLAGRQLNRSTTNPSRTIVVARHVETLSFARSGEAVTVELTSRAGRQSQSLRSNFTSRSR